MLESKDYPEAVYELLENIKDSLEEDGFFDEIGVGNEICRRALDYVAGPMLMKQWIVDGQVTIDEDMIFDIMKLTLVEATILSLKDRGFVDSVFDESNELFFLTKKGKEAIA
jgi:hypothetical protein